MLTTLATRVIISIHDLVKMYRFPNIFVFKIQWTMSRLAQTGEKVRFILLCFTNRRRDIYINGKPDTAGHKIKIGGKRNPIYLEVVRCYIVKIRLPKEYQ